MAKDKQTPEEKPAVTAAPETPAEPKTPEPRKDPPPPEVATPRTVREAVNGKPVPQKELKTNA